MRRNTKNRVTMPGSGGQPHNSRRRVVAIACTWMCFLLVTAGVVRAETSQSATTDVTMNIAEAIEVVSWPDSTVLLTNVAVPGEASTSSRLQFTVRSNSAWGIKVQSDNATGNLREYDTLQAQYAIDGRTSQNSVEWALDTTGPWTGLSSTDTVLISNQAATGEVGSSVSFYLRYTPGFNDIPLGADRTYRIQLTYTAAVGY